MGASKTSNGTMIDQSDAQQSPAPQIVQLNGTYEAFGMVMDYLCRIAPFADFEARVLADSVTDQLNRGQHLVALRERRVVGYAGWLMTTPEVAQGWLDGTRTLLRKDGPDAIARALTIVSAQERSVVIRLIRGARDVNDKGVRVYFKRGGGTTGRTARKTSVTAV